MSSLRLIRVLLIFILFSLTGCLESSFQLSDESRLPKWFDVPEGKERSDVSVQIDLHSTFSGGKAVINFFEKGKFSSIKKYTVTSENQPGIRSVQLMSPPQGYPKGYPRYKVITINGITDIVELRKMEPLFYMTDDPAIWEELGVELK